MFCPWCGRSMVLSPSGDTETMACVAGHMELSSSLHARLAEVFENRTRRGKRRPLAWGGHWFCPGCGCPATVGDGHVRCPSCEELLDEFLSELVELHPHRRRLLLTVEDRFEVRGRGLVLAPFLPPQEARPSPFAVEVHVPDGTVSWRSAHCQVPFLVPTPREPRAHLTLLDATKDEVPVGTRVWTR